MVALFAVLTLGMWVPTLEAHYFTYTAVGGPVPGLTVDYGSKKQMQEAILRIRENPELGREMGERGRSEFQENWRPEIVEERLLEAYDQVFWGRP